ncbi:MAG: hypothetical protein LIO39_04025 [Lachnospiraceae bacterium]|nr:hypothetical protein [Lachnospiraceae bacterium]
MVELFENEKMGENRRSSKGNQLKWKSGDIWYKADYTGYEGLAEYMVSALLSFSDLEEKEYIVYRTEEIRYRQTTYLGCSSVNFLPADCQMVTLERLFHDCYGESLTKRIYSFVEINDRVQFLVNQTERMTGLRDFGVYMVKLLTLDALFLNEDRHMHNIAVLLDANGKFHYCPFFDHGAALLADTTMDYPLTADVESCMQNVKAKTFCRSFDDQLDAAEELYGRHIQFSFTWKDIVGLLEQERYYPKEVKNRVEWVLTEQRRRYAYLFYKNQY